MAMRKIFGRTLRRTAVVAALASTLGAVGVGAAGSDVAGAATSARLTITPTGSNDQYYVTVCGNTSIAYPGGADVEIRLWGDDQWYDDFLGGPYLTSAPEEGAFPCGGNIQHSFLVSGSTLNEDWGEDEIYAGVRVRNRRTGASEKAETNRLEGYWS